MVSVLPWYVPAALVYAAEARSLPSGRLLAGMVADHAPAPTAGAATPPSVRTTLLTFGSPVPVMVTAWLAFAALIVVRLAPVTASLPSGAVQPATGPATPGLSNSARIVIATTGAPRPAATTVAALEIAPMPMVWSRGVSPRNWPVKCVEAGAS